MSGFGGGFSARLTAEQYEAFVRGEYLHDAIADFYTDEHPRIPAFEHVTGPYAHDHDFAASSRWDTARGLSVSTVVCNRCGAEWEERLGVMVETAVGDPVKCDLVPHEEYRVGERVHFVAQ